MFGMLSLVFKAVIFIIQKSPRRMGIALLNPSYDY